MVWSESSVFTVPSRAHPADSPSGSTSPGQTQVPSTRSPDHPPPECLTQSRPSSVQDKKRQGSPCTLGENDLTCDNGVIGFRNIYCRELSMACRSPREIRIHTNHNNFIITQPGAIIIVDLLHSRLRPTRKNMLCPTASAVQYLYMYRMYASA